MTRWTRTLQLWLLAASLVLAPGLSYGHALGHLADGPAGTASKQSVHSAKTVCEQCVALSVFASALPSDFRLHAARHGARWAPRLPVLGLPVWPLETVRARGPPLMP